MLKESDSEEEALEVDARTNKTNNTNRSEKKSSRRDRKSNDLAWLQEDENEDPLDLLDPMAMKHVLATRPLTKEQIKNKNEAKGKNRGFKTSDGKLVIEDSDDESDTDMKSKKSVKSKKAKQPDQIDEMMDTLSIGKKSSASFKIKKKRGLDEQDTDEDDEDDVKDVKSNKSAFKYKAGGSGIHRKLDKNKNSVEIGSEYKAKVEFCFLFLMKNFFI